MAHDPSMARGRSRSTPQQSTDSWAKALSIYSPNNNMSGGLWGAGSEEIATLYRAGSGVGRVFKCVTDITDVSEQGTQFPVQATRPDPLGFFDIPMLQHGDVDEEHVDEMIREYVFDKAHNSEAFQYT